MGSERLPRITTCHYTTCHYNPASAARAFTLLIAGVLIFTGAAIPQSLNGVWRSVGYGYVIDIDGSVLKEFEITKTTCVQGFTAQRQNVFDTKWEAAFKSKNEGVFFIRAGGSNDQKLVDQEDAVAEIRIDRLPRMPAVCDPPTANTPLNNFEVFTRTWAENYISFDLRHANWDEIVAKYRPQISSGTTAAELFEIFEAMIKPLGDLHTYIAAPPLKRSTKEFWRPGTDRVIKSGVDNFASRGRRALFAVTDRGYLQGPLRKFCRGRLQYGHIDATTGYLRILSFQGYSRHNDLRALEAALDSIFSDRTLQALIIDVRLSFGGSDELGLAIANRLAASEYLAYSVRARTAPNEQDPWTHADPVSVHPSSRPSFYGPVVELIGPITMSGAETFAQALMARTPHVTRMGENTQGVFCDVLDRHLPNGWTFGLPNAVYLTAEGIAFDVRGIPPEIEVPVFADTDVAAGRDPAMGKAVQVLSNEKKIGGTPAGS